MLGATLILAGILQTYGSERSAECRAEDRLDFAFRLWDQLVEDGWPPEPTDDLVAELDRRVAAHEADPTKVRTWEQVVERVRRRR